ncbi:MAG: hypothetical protein U0527_10415 [Candidatus Eisenbacteria bacterium]
MKPVQLRSFIGTLLTSRGAQVEEVGAHLLTVTAPAKLAQRLGPSELVLAFHPNGLKENPRSELATVGNPVFERILELALETGRIGQRFMHATTKRRTQVDPTKLWGAAAGGVGPAEPIYTPVYFLLFKIEYSLEEVPDELEAVAIDGLTLEAWKETPELAEFWMGLEEEPDAGRRAEPAFPVPESVGQVALQTLERKLRKRVARVRRISEEHLERETESIKGYYEQLIHETRNVGRRWNSSADEKSDRIRVLQLDWKRRIEEAQQFWGAQHDVRLSAIGVAFRPRLRFRPKARGRTKAGGPSFYFDEIEQAPLGPR